MDFKYKKVVPIKNILIVDFRYGTITLLQYFAVVTPTILFDKGPFISKI